MNDFDQTGKPEQRSIENASVKDLLVSLAESRVKHPHACTEEHQREVAQFLEALSTSQPNALSSKGPQQTGQRIRKRMLAKVSAALGHFEGGPQS